MSDANLRESLNRLEKANALRRIDAEVDPHLEMAEIHRRVHQAKGPALYFARVKGSSFPCVSNLFGTRGRALLLLGDGVRRAQKLLKLRADPVAALRRPLTSLAAAWGARHAWPRKVGAPDAAAVETTLSRLPQIVTWPKDGGAFVTLPQVYSEHPDHPGLFASNLGMYRVQFSGGEYAPDREAGFHYQIHRGIGVHHHAAIRRREKLRVSVFVGGPPAHMLAAVLPLPEGVPEVLFAGLLAGRPFRYGRRNGFLLSADADFCITGTVDPLRTLPEGPFGDHLGYYSLAHPFPVLTVEKVFHRRGAIWPFTVVGRPPQEDAQLAELIHEIGGGILPREIPGLRAVHAVEAAGVHPLLLALAEDRYAPYAESQPRELHTIGHALLGYGQLSLAKYLWLASAADHPGLDIRDVPAFLSHVLRRASWEKDLHFITRTTMDTLDYSGGALHEGSKVLLAVSGAPRRELAASVPETLLRLWPDPWMKPRVVLPGVLAFGGAPADTGSAALASELEKFSVRLRDAGEEALQSLRGFPLWVLADDPEFTARSLDNFLWTAFTRSDPARDVHGLFAFTQDKHWGCRGPLVIDARLKPYHAPPLETDPDVARRVEEMAAPGRPLHGLF
jgi:4-hydroxy-3-polyprenylbenzoate decarboxylase